MYKVKGTLSFSQLSLLTYREGDKFISKSGKEYIEGLSKVFHLANRNDKPFSVEDIKNEPLLNQFSFSGARDFVYICDLIAEPMTLTIMGNSLKRKNERIKAINFTSNENKNIFKSSLGVAYILTALVDGNEHIIKFGQTRTSFEKRLSSYNCGTVNAWRTASTTNIKMLQSFVTTRAVFKLYLYDCSHEVETYIFHGIESVPFASSMPLAIEDIMLKQYYNQFGKHPLANIQANATTIIP